MPIVTLQQRLREVGRIRIGQKGPKGGPQRLTTFRFTSFDRRAVEAAASIWGGKVKECTEPELVGQFEVITNAAEIPIMASPMDPTQYMELWSGGECQRRCDGQTELRTGCPCMCEAGSEECKPTTRLPVILPDLPGLGVWRLESRGWHAAAELIQSFEMLRALNGRREMAEGLLAIEERRSKKDGTRLRFIVPVIRIGMAPRQLLAQAQAAAFDTSRMSPELAASMAAQAPPAPELPSGGNVHRDSNPRGRFFAVAHEMGLPPHANGSKQMYYTVCGRVLGRTLDTLSTVTDAEWETLASWIMAVQRGEKAMPRAFRDAIPEHDPLSEAEADPFADPEPVVS
jgi:hypothetical protein